jgi:hypothetical protein
MTMTAREARMETELAKKRAWRTAKICLACTPLAAVLGGVAAKLHNDRGVVFLAVVSGLIGVPVLVDTIRGFRAGLRGSAVALFVIAVLSAFVGLFAFCIGFWIFSSNSRGGRPLRVRRRVLVTPLAQGTAWCSDLPVDVATMTYDERATRAAGWLAEARGEHASVPAFARLSIDLVAAGAPPELVACAHRAALDEIDHARTCFGLAKAYCGHTVGAGPFPALIGDRDRSSLLNRLARESLVDGCGAESEAASRIRRAASRASDQLLRQNLERIAVDEERHVEFAWSIVKWCLQEGGLRVAEDLTKIRVAAHVQTRLALLTEAIVAPQVSLSE